MFLAVTFSVSICVFFFVYCVWQRFSCSFFGVCFLFSESCSSGYLYLMEKQSGARTVMLLATSNPIRGSKTNNQCCYQ